MVFCRGRPKPLYQLSQLSSLVNAVGITSGGTALPPVTTNGRKLISQTEKEAKMRQGESHPFRPDVSLDCHRQATWGESPPRFGICV